MGLGKTIQALVVSQILTSSRVLILCPAIAKGVWEKEAQKWLGESVQMLSGLVPKNESYQQKFVVANYDILAERRVSRRNKDGGFTTMQYCGWRDSLALDFNPDLVILDEAHLLKNGDANRTSAVKDILENAKYKLALTGTPTWDNLLDIHGLMDTLDPGIFGSRFKYAHAYMRPFQKTNNDGSVIYGWEYKGVNEARLDELKQRVGFYMISRKKADVLPELPPKQRTVIPVAREGWTRNYQGLAKEKVEHTIELARSLLLEKPHIVVFSHFVETTRAIAKRLKGYCITGKERTDRGDIIARWEASGGALCMTTGAGGVALNLQVADTVVFNDLEWSPAALLQAEDRVHRLGQSRPCGIYYVVARGTVDDSVAATLLEKLEAAEAIRGGNESLAVLVSEETSVIDRITSLVEEWEEDDAY